MSTVSRPRKPVRQVGAVQRQLWCTACDTDEHLSVGSVQSLQPSRAAVVNAAYTCVQCGHSFSHPATVAQVARVLDRRGPGLDVLQFGGAYFHCGEPMPTDDYERSSICGPVTTEVPYDGLMAVQLPIRVLRCCCGFQMEIPH